MKDISKEWLEYSKGDLKNAVILFENKSYKDCIWYCHQATEKLLKAIITNQGKGVRKIHDLVELWEEANLTPNESISRFLEELNPYYIPTRYPEAEEEIQDLVDYINMTALLQKHVWYKILKQIHAVALQVLQLICQDKQIQMVTIYLFVKNNFCGAKALSVKCFK